MKKIYSVFLTLVLGLLLLPFVVSVEADTTNPIGTTFDFNLNTKFGENEPVVTALGNKTYGDTVAIDAGSYAGTGYQFATYIVNKKVQPTLAASTSFIVSEDLMVTAIYKPTGTYAVAFMDSNQEMLDVQFVSSGSNATPPDVSGLTKPGYVVDTGTTWSGSYNGITQDTVLWVQYVLDDTNSYTLSVNNGTGGGTYAYNEVATVVASGTGTFQYWMMDGNIVSLQETYSFTILADTFITAVYSAETDGSSNPVHYVDATAPSIGLRDPYSIKDGYRTYVGQFYLPEGIELVEYGLIAHTDSGEFTFSDSVGLTKYRAFKYNPLTNEFVLSLNDSISPNVRAYMITTDGSTETISYSFYNEGVLISEFGESSSDKWLEIYNPNNYAVEMSAYSLALFSNGAVSPTNTLSLSGVTIGANDVYVIAEDGNTQTTIGADAYSSVANSNGNDTIALYKNGLLMDVIGVIGSDAVYASDQTMLRDTGVARPIGTYFVDEWSFAAVNFDDVGFHNPTNPASITITGATEVMEGSTIALGVTYPANTIQGVTWESSNTDMATVDSSGVVTGVSTGTVTITATSTADTNVTDTYSVDVTAAVSAIVSYEENGGSLVPDETVAIGSAATRPTDPTKSSYSFIGWYSDSELTTLYDFDSTVTTNITLYAKWVDSATFTETFALFPESSSSYNDGSYVGDNGYVWTYVGARGDQNIDGDALCLNKASSENAYVTATISGGISSFSIQYKNAFSTPAGVELYINDVLIATSTEISNKVDTTFTVDNIDIQGEFTITIKTTNGQLTIDNLSWTTCPSD